MKKKYSSVGAITIFLIAILQVFSSVFFVPGGEDYGLSIFRIFVLSVSILIFLRLGLEGLSSYEKRCLLLIFIFIIWMIVSLFWSENFLIGVKHVAYFSTILLLTYTLFYLVKSRNQINFLLSSVSIIGLAIFSASFYEINTGNHFFRSSLQDVSELDRSLSYITENQAWFTFGNPNDLAVHIAICCFSTIMFSKSRAYSISYLFIGLYLVNQLDSRIVIIALVMFTVLYLLFSYQKISRVIERTSLLVIFMGALAFLFVLWQVDQVEFLDVSSFVRLQLIASAFDMAQHSFLVGIGVGGFEAEMWRGGYLARTIGIANPHNAFGRLLAENGVLGLMLFVYMLFLPLFAIRRAPQASQLVAAIASSVIVIPLLLSVGSDPMSSSSLQLAIALMLVGARSAINEVQPHKPEHGRVQPHALHRNEM